MNVNLLVHPVGPPRYSKVSLPSISDIFCDLPQATPAYPPSEQRNYYLGTVSPQSHNGTQIARPPYNNVGPNALPPLTSPHLAASVGSREPPSPQSLQTSPQTRPHQLLHNLPHHQARSGSSSSSSSITSQSSEQQQQPTSPGGPKRKTRNNLPKETTYILLKWLNEHLNHPYPNSFEKNQLMLSTGLNQQQLSNWFINARRRKIKVLKRSETTL